MDNLQSAAAFHLKADFFAKGSTYSEGFRKESLQKLLKSIRKHESAIIKALYSDLGKPELEAYTTEIAIVYKELNHSLRKLKSWINPQKVPVSLVHFPSTSYIYPEPLGVVLIIAPWNYPFQLVMAPLIAAIAAGNCVILKPSEEAPATEKIIKKIISESFSDEYISVITGSGSEVVPFLFSNYRFGHVFFTGSTAIGKKIAAYAASALTPVTLELGGKSPAIVSEDAHLKIAARRIVWGKFMNAGQTCISPDYLIVHASVKNSLMEYMIESIREFYGRHGLKNKAMGRIINEKRYEKLKSYLHQGTILEGGIYEDDYLYIAPTILDNVNYEETVMQEEIFGPILPVLTYEKTEDIFEIIQHNSHPLALYVFTENRDFEHQIIQSVQFGGGCVNNTLIHLSEPDLPFGGIGNSGIGRYHGKAGFDVFSHMKSIVRTATWFDAPFKYPPYSKLKNKIIRWIFR